MALAAVVCSLGYVFLTTEAHLQLEPDGSSRIHSASWRRVLTPTEFYTGQLRQVRAEIAEIERTYVSPSVYAARFAQQSRDIKDQVMATPGVKEVFVAAEQRQSPAERTASALERQASEIRAQEERMQIAQAHDLVVRQRLADLQKLKAFIESKLK